jgi:hypothetical protein
MSSNTPMSALERAVLVFADQLQLNNEELNSALEIGDSIGVANIIFAEALKANKAKGWPVVASDPIERKYRNSVRYCEFPANRLNRLVQFEVNGNPLDQYDSVASAMYEKICVAPGKRTGYNRLCGQEVPMEGYGGVELASIDGGGDAGQTEYGGAPAGQVIARRKKKYANGPQTPKPVQAPLELWHSLKFWFCGDVRCSVPSVSIPFGQRFVAIEFAPQEELVYEVPVLEATTTTVTTIETLIEGQIQPNVQMVVERQTTPVPTRLGLQPLKIEAVELYVNNIFVNPEIHDIYIKRVGFTLVRVHRQHTQRCNADKNDEILLSQLKWPIEYMFVGLRPAWNVRSENANQWRDWHRLTRQVDARHERAWASRLYTTQDGQNTEDRISIVGTPPSQYWLPVPTVDTLSLTSHGITIFDGFGDAMFNHYMPLHYGAEITTPDDPGALFVNMALFPGAYQPSGHLNISRARETYLSWTSSYSGAKTPVDLLVVAIAINFLLIAEGSAVLRYST